MTLPLTTEALRAAYDLLNATPPFSRWNLPDGEDIEFKVVRDPRCYGWYQRRRGRHVIAVSRRMVGYTSTLLRTMAHEMVHVHEGHTGVDKARVEHSAAFRKWAAQVCRVHGFDPRDF